MSNGKQSIFSPPPGLTLSRLYDGCVLASIVHAVMNSRMPELSFMDSWNGLNYSIQDGSGTRSTISFTDSGCVGVFRDDGSFRCPWRMEGDYKIDPFFVGAPDNIQALAEATTLQYVLDEWNGVVGPVISTAFWHDGSAFDSTDTWTDFEQHGGHILASQCLPFEDAWEAWEEDYEMSANLLTLAKRIFAQKQAHPNERLQLPGDDYAIIAADATEEGISESRTSFAEIGIDLP